MANVSLAYRSLRILYLATLLALIFPRALLGAGGWVGIATGSVIGMLGLGLLPLIAISAWRFIYVIRNPLALASPPGHPVAAVIRGLGVLLMAVSTLASIAQFFVGPITHMLLGRADGGEAGVGYFVVSLGLYLVSGFALLAILLFELGRWVSRQAESVSPTIRRRVAGAAVACVVLLVSGHLGARAYVRSGYRALLAHCGTITQPVMKRQVTELPASFLVRENGPPELPNLAWRSNMLARASGLAFVESCGKFRCSKLIPSAMEGGFPSRARLSTPTSPIEMQLSSTSVEKTFLSARLLRLQYEIRTTNTHEVLAEVSEWVYDWGDWNRAGSMYGTTRREACGYAQPDVHPFRPNAIGNAIADAYTAADVRFLLSVVPQAMQPANAATTVEMLSPWQPEKSQVDARPSPPVGPIETVVSESSQERRRTFPSLADGSRAAELRMPATNVPPAATLLEDFHGTVHLSAQMSGSVSEDGLILDYCCAGALVSAAATGTAPAGRSYMEAMFIAEQGRQTVGTFTQLGVGAASGARAFDPESARFAAPTRTLKSGDVVGVLIDTDLRRVEYYVKGQRISTRDLHELHTTEFRVWVTVSAGHGGTGSSDRWVVNFGATPFVYPPNDPFLTYEGRIHRR